MNKLPTLKVGDTFQCVNGCKRTIITNTVRYATLSENYVVQTEWYDSIEELMKKYDGKFLKVIDFL